MALNPHKKTITARLYIKTPFFMKCIDVVEAPNVEYIDVAIRSEGIGWMSASDELPMFKQDVATFKKYGYDPINKDYLFVNEFK